MMDVKKRAFDAEYFKHIDALNYTIIQPTASMSKAWAMPTWCWWCAGHTTTNVARLDHQSCAAALGVLSADVST
ncbi:hypothetical protein ABIB80_007872 [Bradyrhizobium sp. i1.15.2]|uniref:hypothetical protein n=1 Tax=Bradyrhizobium sp. i1.15.2 TaxID=3156362 RepID=UPI0033975969